MNQPCLICKAYLERRANVLAPAISLRSFIRGVAAEVVAREYVFAVHRRHLAGGCLSTRPRTPDRKNPDGSTRVRVKRSCDCGQDLGDARPDELDAAMAGLPLPDVRLECGCSSEGAAA